MKSQVIITLDSAFVRKESVVYRVPALDFLQVYLFDTDAKENYEILNLEKFKTMNHVPSNLKLSINNMFGIKYYKFQEVDKFDEIWGWLKYKITEDIDDCVKRDWVV